MARIIYRVAPSGSNWTVKRDGILQSTHDNKQPAVDAGSAGARREWEVYKRPSQCVIHRADGTIEKEWTYGNDPYPPPG
jgi:1,2-phenylacetyl-CoA epoxidase PaaB subunit